jgi:hypothetical protein
MNKKIYTINGRNIGIDLESIICFYELGNIDTYHGKFDSYLRILIGYKGLLPHELTFIRKTAKFKPKDSSGASFDIVDDEGCKELHNDLIEQFKNTN